MLHINGIRFQDKSLIRVSLKNLTFHPRPDLTDTKIRPVPNHQRRCRRKVNYDENHKSSFFPLSSVDRFFFLSK